MPLKEMLYLFFIYVTYQQTTSTLDSYHICILETNPIRKSSQPVHQQQLLSSSSMVSQNALPLVSGKHTPKIPLHPIANPKTPQHKNLCSLPAATNTGLNAPPNATVCLTNDNAEFRIEVGNNSVVYIRTTSHAVQAQEKDINSNTICSLLIIITPSMVAKTLETPLMMVRMKIILLLLNLSRSTQVRNADRISDKALNVTLR